MNRVVVTGMGALTPIGNDLDSFWKNLLAGKSGAEPITKFNAEKFKMQFACEIKDSNLEDHIPRSEARRYDPFTSYALLAVEEALKNGEIDFEGLDKTESV